MQKTSNRRAIAVILLLLLALIIVVATVSAAEVSGLGTAIAAVDSQGLQGINNLPISGIDHQPISPWGIDAVRYIW